MYLWENDNEKEIPKSQSVNTKNILDKVCVIVYTN